MSFRALPRKAIVVLLCTVLLLFSMFVAFPASQVHAAGETVNVWLTTGDQTNLLAAQPSVAFASGDPSSSPNNIYVNENQAYQQIDGFGANFSDLAAGLMYYNMSSSQRNALLSYLFDPTNGVGFSAVRLAIGSNDQVYNTSYHNPPSASTYDDNGGVADPNLTNFSIAHDLTYTVPELQQVLGIAPGLKILATPWLQPSWMLTTNNSLCSNGDNQTLASNDYGTYANYLVKFLQAYQNQSIPIWAITPQNEPTCLQYNVLDASQETTLIKNNLGPTFASNSINTAILDMDSNWDNTSYPSTVLGDATASSYVLGSAWHAYAGSPTAMSNLLSQYPSKGNYVTEYGSGSWPVPWSQLTDSSNGADKIIQAMRNGAKMYLYHALANDTNADMGTCNGHTNGICAPLLTIDKTSGNYALTPLFYAEAQFSKFVRPGAYRIDSNGGMENVAFKNPDGSKVLVVANTDQSNSHTFAVVWGNESFSYTLPENSVATFTWAGTQGPAGGSLARVDDSVQGNGYNQFNYIGSGWGHCTSCDTGQIGTYNQSNSWDTTGGDTVTVKFHGTGIAYYDNKAPSGGYADISVDGANLQTVDMYAPTSLGDQNVYSVSGLPLADHTLTVKVDGTHDSNSSNIYVAPDRVDITTAAPTDVDDAVMGTGNNQFNYVGSGWGHCMNCDNPPIGRYDASNSWDSTAGDSVTFQFTGTGVGLYVGKGPSAGYADVSIDGGTPVPIGLYAPNSAGNQLGWAISGLSYGSHTLKVVVDGRQEASATNDYVVIDRAQVTQS